MIRIVAGLGNPGSAYRRTRHNVGFDVVERLAESLGVEFRPKPRWFAEVAEARHEGRALLLVKPLTYMNDSGKAVAAARQSIGAKPPEILVVFDDVDLDTGRLRLREKGGAGGHNGMRSIIASLGAEDFPRLRVGVGPRPSGEDLANYVLNKWPPDAQCTVSAALGMAVEAVRVAIDQGIGVAMNRFNTATIS